MKVLRADTEVSAPPKIMRIRNLNFQSRSILHSPTKIFAAVSQMALSWWSTSEVSSRLAKHSETNEGFTVPSA